ncbi:class I SAM-dependent methyltransferase [Candidatus Omnitrophota bacterium]
MREVLPGAEGNGQKMKNTLINWSFQWRDIKFALSRGIGLCLDLGCGTGRHRDAVEQAGWTWVGMDTDTSRGEVTVVGDGMRLPVSDNSFDMVLLWQTLEHVPQPWVVLAEAKRVLKPGGRIVGSASCLEPFHDVTSYFGFTHKGLAKMLADSGFADIEITPGLNAFSLIARSWFRRLIGPKLGERLGFALIRGLFIPSVWTYLFLRGSWNVLKRGRPGPDYKRTVQWLTQDAPLEFAGHLVFKGNKV